MNVRRILLWLFVLFFPLPMAAGAAWFSLQEWAPNWRAADWTSAGIAPDPARHREAIVQVYAARTGRWKSIFAVHSWIALKPVNAKQFTRYEVVGWGSPVRRDNYPVDGRWYGNEPHVVYELRGAEAEALIPKIEKAVAAYPYARRGDYQTWPGPNSNSFVAGIARAVPGFDPRLPAVAVGKDFLGDGLRLAAPPSKTGWQVSLFGALGFTLARAEGLEINILGLVAGINPLDLSITVPSFGRIGLQAMAAPNEAAAISTTAPSCRTCDSAARE